MSAAREQSYVPPKDHRVLFENDRVRVLEVRVLPGETSGMHEHPAAVVYQLSDARVRFAFPDGSSREIASKVGDINWTDGVRHEVHNIGTTDDLGIIVELKR